MYFFFQDRNSKRATNTLNKNVIDYALFAGFICLQIPFSIFFPAWLSEKLEVVERTSDNTMYFLLFGCVVLAISMWIGWKSRPKAF